MSTASGFSSRHKLWTYCLVCYWLGCWLCSGGLKGCIFLCLLSWTLWCILWCYMGKLSPFNGDPEWGFWMGVLNRAVRGMNGGCTGQLYRADLDTIELISMSWSFWCLAHFPMTDSSLLNGAPVQGLWTWVLNGAVRGLNGAIQGGLMGLILVPLNSSHCADRFDIWLIFLWLMVLFWMGILYRAVRGLWMGL